MIVVAGPTGSGKSALALALACDQGGEIVNCDSLQIYRGFDIGTAKTPAADRRDIPHHLFDVLDPQMRYSAGDYARQAREALTSVTARGKVPIVTGGTGFYLRALLGGLPALPNRDENLRARLASREQERPNSLHRILTRLDKAAARAIHANDVQKVTRALEIRLLTRAPRPRSGATLPLTGYRVIKIGLNPDRVELDRRLDARVEQMFREGLIDEVRGLLAAGQTGAEKPFESLGYKQALAFLRGAMTLADAIESTKIQTRQYAKRQRTWFRREPGIFWIPDFGDSPTVADEARKLVNGFVSATSKK